MARRTDGRAGDAPPLTALRKQYYFRPSARGYYAWDVDRLIRAASALEIRDVALSDIRELDEPSCLEGSNEVPTYRELAEHARLVEEADLTYPIIISASGRVMDGMHRVMQALNAGQVTIRAVIFEQDPKPDYVDVQPQALPY